MSRFDVLTIGNAIVDIIARCDDLFLNNHGIVKAAMNLIDAERAELLYAAMGERIEASGGSAGNTAAGAASLGARTAYIGKVADDPLGAVFDADMAAIGVHYGTKPLRGGAPTARSMIFITPDGERSMNTFLGACVELGPQDIDADVVAEAAITYFEGYLWDPPLAKDAIRLAAGIAHRNGRRTAITLSDSFCVDRWRTEFLDLIRDRVVDIVFANEAELTALYQCGFDEALAKLKGECRLAAVTRSEKGAIIIEDGALHTIQAYPIRELVDANGAGDAFAAGVLHGLTSGMDTEAAGALGAFAAAQVIQKIGPRNDINLAEAARAAGLMD